MQNLSNAGLAMEIPQGILCYSEEFTVRQHIWRSCYIPGSPSETNRGTFMQWILVRYHFTREYGWYCKFHTFLLRL